jgi:hypothetical protein
MIYLALTTKQIKLVADALNMHALMLNEPDTREQTPEQTVALDEAKLELKDIRTKLLIAGLWTGFGTVGQRRKNNEA